MRIILSFPIVWVWEQRNSQFQTQTVFTLFWNRLFICVQHECWSAWCLPLFHTHHQMHFCAQISLQLNLKVHQLLPNTISAENYTFTLLDFQWSLCLKLEVVSGQLVTPWPCRTLCVSYTTFKCTKFLYRYGCFEGSSVILVQRTCSETEKRQNAYRKCVTNHSAQMTHNY